jgi:hypothetical protein
MVFDISTALNWLLFLALFPIAFYWFRRAWRIFVKRDFSEVALKAGMPPKNPEKFAPFSGVVNLVAALIISYTIFGVLSGTMAFDTWSALAGSTLWMKIIFDFIIRRHAHMEPWGRKKKTDESQATADASNKQG